MNSPRRLMKVAFPEARNAHAALAHVSVLRPVKAHALALPFVGFGEPVGVAVPIVAIPLDHEISRWDEGVNGELPVDDVLPDVVHLELVEDGVSDALWLGRRAELLHRIHPGQMLLPAWALVTAFDGAITNVVRLFAGRRPSERLAAYLARVIGFIAALPLVCAIDRAESRDVLAVMQDGVFPVTPFARQFGSLAAFHLRGSRIAVVRAITLLRTKVPRVHLATPRASDCPDLVPGLTFCHAVIVARSRELR